MKQLLYRVIKYAAIIIVSVIAFMIVFPLIFQEKITKKTSELISESVQGEFSFDKISLSFFRHFPVLTVSMENFTLCKVPGYAADTLVSGSEFSVGLNLLSLFGTEITIGKVYGNGLKVNIEFDESADAGDQTLSEPDEIFNGRVSIESVQLRDTYFRFYDSASDILLVAEGVRYRGRGRFQDGSLTLRSLINFSQISVAYEGVTYIKEKSGRGRLQTKVSASGLEYQFVKNRVRIANLDASFMGSLLIKEQGFSIEMNLKTDKTNLSNFLSLLPPEYSGWLSDTKINGRSFMELSLTDEELDVHFFLEDGLIKHAEAPFPLEKIEATIKYKMPMLEYEKSEISIEKFLFELSGECNRLSLHSKGIDKPYIDLSAIGRLNLALLTEAIGFDGYNFAGDLGYSIQMNGIFNPSDSVVPAGELLFEIEEGSISTPYTDYKMTQIGGKLRASSEAGSLEDLSVTVDSLKFVLADGQFFITSHLNNFLDIEYFLEAEGVLKLNELYSLFGVEEGSVKGVLDAGFIVRGGVKEGSGSLVLSDFEYRSNQYPYPFKLPSATLKFEGERAILSDTELVYGSGKFNLKGYLSDFMSYYFSQGEVKGALFVNSQYLLLSDFIALLPETDSSENESLKGVIPIPERISLSLNANIREIEYETLKASNFGGEIAISNGAFYINGTGVNIAGARFMLDATYKPLSPALAEVEFRAKADSFDIVRAYREVPMFADLFSSAANMEGIISMDYFLSTKLDEYMNPIYPTVKGGGFIRLEDVNVRGLRVLGAISSATGRDSLNNPNLKAVQINSKIANNIITIERTRMRIFGFRPRFEGQASLDGRLNINFRLGLPPLGIIGIPLTITGTMENPQVNVRRGRDGDILYEEEYTNNNNL